MSDPAPIATVPAAFVMLPGAGPSCDGDDCLPAAPLAGAPHPQSPDRSADVPPGALRRS